MPLTPKQRRRIRFGDPDKFKPPASLKELVAAFGSGEALRSTAVAVKRISGLRGISGDAAATLLRTSRKQIEQGRKRLTVITKLGPVTTSVARASLSEKRRRIGKQSLPTVGGALPSDIIKFVIKTAKPGQIGSTRTLLKLRR